MPPFEPVTIEGESLDWTKVTSNLGSLVTVPQVLLAGYVAETIKHDILEDISPRKSKLIEEAESWLGAYVDEYYTGDFIKRRRDTKNLLMKIFGYVKETIQTHWASVDTLANALVQQKTLSEEKAFELIERDIPDDLKMKAKTELSRTVPEKLAVILEQAQDLKSTSKQVVRKRFWWEFWKK